MSVALVVDDHPEGIYLLRCLLAAAGTPFQLAILDLTVRGGLGGIETLARLRHLDPNLLAIAITGYADQALQPDLRASGFATVLAKPFMLHELCSTIKAVLP